MGMTDNGRMTLISSQRSTEQNKYVDLDNTRSPFILFNRVCYACPQHIRSLYRSNTSLLKCPCKFFAPPQHLTIKDSYKEILNVFSSSEDNMKDENRLNMLREIGVIPPPDMYDINHGSIQNNSFLFSQEGLDHFLKKTICIQSYIDDPNIHVSKTIVMYLDPTTFSADSSLNAMSFVTNIIYSDQQSEYVILAVEHFKTEDVDPDEKNVCKACSALIISVLELLTSWYDNYFDRLIIAPESNSLNLEPLAFMLSQVFFINKTLNSKITIQFTSVDRGTISNSSCKDINGMKPYVKRRKISKLCIGYLLKGNNKTKDCVNFYADIFNKKILFCAKCIISLTLQNIPISIVSYIGDQLQCVRIIKKKTTKAYYITGKDTNKTDDLAISTIMSVQIYRQINNPTMTLIDLPYPSNSSCTADDQLGYLHKQDHNTFYTPENEISLVIPKKFFSIPKIVR